MTERDGWVEAHPSAEALPLFPDTDLRVLLPEGDEFASLAGKFSSAGARACQVRYLLEDEAIIVDG